MNLTDKAAERDQLVASFKAGTINDKQIDRLLVLEAMFAGGVKSLLDTPEQIDRWFDIRRSRR